MITATSLPCSTKWNCMTTMKILPQTKYVATKCSDEILSVLLTAPVSPAFSLHLMSKPGQVKVAESSLDLAWLDIQYRGTQSMLEFMFCSSCWEPAQTLFLLNVCMFVLAQGLYDQSTLCLYGNIVTERGDLTRLWPVHTEPWVRHKTLLVDLYSFQNLCKKLLCSAAIAPVSTSYSILLQWHVLA